MSTGEHFSLRWNNYSNHIANAFDSLRSQEDFVDVTLCCEGRKIRAHKVLLSACSLYFRDVFKENPCQHPVIVFKNVKYDDLLALIGFMYQGEVSVQQESLPSFLTTAEMLSVQGLSGGSSLDGSSSGVKDVPLHSTSSGTTSYVQTLPPLVTSGLAGAQQGSQQLHTTQHVLAKGQANHHSALNKRAPTMLSSVVGDLKFVDASSSATVMKTYALQTVMNKTQVPAPISIPATVKLRSIPAPKAQPQSTIVQQQQTQTIIENVPVKRRRVSTTADVLADVSADLDDTDFIVNEVHEHLQQQSLQQQQIVDEADETNEDDDDEEDEDDTEESSSQFVKMEIPDYMNETTSLDSQQQHDQQQNDVVVAVHDDVLDDEDDDEDEDEQHLEQHSPGEVGDHDHDAGQTDVGDTYGIMESSDLELMYQDHQNDQQQNQQNNDMDTLFASQSSLDESTSAPATNIQLVKSHNESTSGNQQSTDGSLNKWSQCQFCKVVITTVNLWRHIRTQHTPQPPRPCDHCSKSFKNKYSLREHVRIAHEGKNVQQFAGSNAAASGSTASADKTVAKSSSDAKLKSDDAPSKLHELPSMF